MSDPKSEAELQAQIAAIKKAAEPLVQAKHDCGGHVELSVSPSDWYAFVEALEAPDVQDKLQSFAEYLDMFAKAYRLNPNLKSAYQELAADLRSGRYLDAKRHADLARWHEQSLKACPDLCTICGGDLAKPVGPGSSACHGPPPR